VKETPPITNFQSEPFGEGNCLKIPEPLKNIDEELHILGVRLKIIELQNGRGWKGPLWVI